MRLEPTIYSNHHLIIDEHDIPVGVQINGKLAYQLNDIVRITDDGHGYIGPGISNEGIGTITEIRRDDTDHFYGVRMNNGEFGYLKDSRIELIRRC